MIKLFYRTFIPNKSNLNKIEVNSEIRILQIIRDEKFIGSTKIVERNNYIQSESVAINPDSRVLDKFIKYNIKILRRKSDLIKKIQKGDYDVLFFHSLPVPYYDIVGKIPSDKIVIWYSYGFDIYGDKYHHGLFGLPAFVEKDLYKSQTRQVLTSLSTIKQYVKVLLGKLYYYPRWVHRYDVIRRIDYFQPVKPLDFKLMKNVVGFRAKEIFLCNYGQIINGKEYIRHRADGAIILGNAASPLINHLDVWSDLENNIPIGKTIIMPLSYGNMEYANKVKKVLRRTSFSFQFLDTFLSRNDYFKMMDDCSYAVYGSLRQHAMGNIFHALSNDIKVFLYRDSLMFGYLREMGFVIYAIEDIDSNSFKTPITEVEHNQNVKAFEKQHNYCYNKGQDMLEEIAQLIYKKHLE